MKRLKVIAFDVIETLFPLEPFKDRLKSLGLPGEALEIWFAQLARDAMALETTGSFKDFRQVAAAALEGVMSEKQVQPSVEMVQQVLEGFGQLPAHPDVRPTFESLHNQSMRIITLTNGSAQTTQQLIERAGVARLVEKTISIDEVKHWKPAREVYLHAAVSTGVAPSEMALVAAHGWDIQGGGHAGLVTGYVSRKGRPFPTTMNPPDVQADNLEDVVRRLLNMS